MYSTNYVLVSFLLLLLMLLLLFFVVAVVHLYIINIKYETNFCCFSLKPNENENS